MTESNDLTSAEPDSSVTRDDDDVGAPAGASVGKTSKMTIVL